MGFVFDPPTSTKITKMKERVRWQHPLIAQRGIDQTRLAFEQEWADQPDFSFSVIGDTGSGSRRMGNPQRRIAEYLLECSQDSRFLLHTGDVIYLVGSDTDYAEKFIQPYRELIVGGEQLSSVTYDRLVFSLPFLPVLGNHDYCDLSPWLGVLARAMLPLYRLLGSSREIDLSWRGSQQGNAFAKAFLDYLKGLDHGSELAQHLDHHYTIPTDTGRCLRYQAGQFTRLPNRYYTFRIGGIDFFALDSTTLNVPSTCPETPLGEADCRWLQHHRTQLEQEAQQMLEEMATLRTNWPDRQDKLKDLQNNLKRVKAKIRDIDQHIAAADSTAIDFEQLEWLRQKLIDSWHTPEVRGRVIYFHHPPYVTEATKCGQLETLAIRHHLRWVLDEVSAAIGIMPQGRPLVDLIISGHAHCLEYLRTGDTGHADSHLNWLVCGGSGFSVRRQSITGSQIRETFPTDTGSQTRLVANSQLFVGLRDESEGERHSYSFARIDVQEGCPPKFIVRPFVVERYGQQWHNRPLEPLLL
ncbi:metallophosphoesterase [Lyngbya aestuarii]|uniref:metallophosphoesterase n=1 Tax=Lyngbya aestuarii TaxID=118322 RepID=UPI00403E2820